LILVGEDGMSQNALLRSVKGLGVPSTARREDRKTKLKVAASAAESPQEFPCKDHFAIRHGVRCAGVHLIVDLHGAKRLNDIDHIEATLRRCVEAARATLLHIHLHHFQPSGVSGVAVLAESHISIHTWPEAGYAALDIFMCGSAEPDNCVPVLREAFGAKRVEVNEILRGQDA
jgi:S-adenosylmethionine decarboxylase